MRFLLGDNKGPKLNEDGSVPPLKETVKNTPLTKLTVWAEVKGKKEKGEKK